MKNKLILPLIIALILGFNLSAQKSNSYEKYGKTLNLGLGIGGYSGYYGYLGRTLPVFHINYEFDVANNFTIAPFITFFTYSGEYYHESVIPIGAKGTYYFDQILNANSDWDFYLAGSLGFALINTTWDNDYHGDKHYNKANSLFLDLHLGTEYHISNGLGIFLDLSTGVSTIGIAIH